MTTNDQTMESPRLDPVAKAIDAYKKEKLNCAQSVLRGFQDTHDIPGEHIAAAKAFGGGRAEGGRCGALHAAMLVAERGNVCTKTLSQSFASQAGSEQCRDIRSQRKITCAQCVELAAKLLTGKTTTSSCKGEKQI